MYRSLVVQFCFSGGGGGGGKKKKTPPPPPPPPPKQYYLYIRLPALYHLTLRQNDVFVS